MCDQKNCQIIDQNGLPFGCENINIFEGTCKGVWKIVEKIGEGEFGIVYSACAVDGCLYAIKINSNKPEYYQEALLQQEIYTTTTLSPRVYQILTNKEHILIVMDRMQDTLKDRLIAILDSIMEDQEKIKFIYDFVIKVVSCIDKLHSYGYAHLDAGLDNIMFDQTNTLKFIDFAFSKKTTDPKLFDKDISIFFDKLYTLLNMYLPETETTIYRDIATKAYERK